MICEKCLVLLIIGNHVYIPLRKRDFNVVGSEFTVDFVPDLTPDIFTPKGFFCPEEQLKNQCGIPEIVESDKGLRIHVNFRDLFGSYQQ